MANNNFLSYPKSSTIVELEKDFRANNISEIIDIFEEENSVVVQWK